LPSFKKFVSSHRTRSSTFAIRTKLTRKPKIAKELALLASHMENIVQLERIENKNNKVE
jgi:hypothetical protein